MPGLDDQIESFCHDHHSGSAELAETALSILKDALRPASAFSIEKLAGIALKLIRGQPSMAAVINVGNDVCLTAEENLRISGSTVLFEEFNAIGRNIAEENQTTISDAAGILCNYDSIAAYSRSSLVEKALIESGKKNPDQKIFLSESRPGNEGLTLARNLALSGIKTTLCADAALPGLIENCQALVIGSDAVALNRFSNKTGTRWMCQAALKAGIPICILAPRNKFLPPALQHFYRIEDLTGHDIFDPEPDNIRVYNRLFEWIDIDPAFEFIGEYGKTAGTDLEKIFADKEIANCLKNECSE